MVHLVRLYHHCIQSTSRYSCLLYLVIRIIYDTIKTRQADQILDAFAHFVDLGRDDTRQDFNNGISRIAKVLDVCALQGFRIELL